MKSVPQPTIERLIVYYRYLEKIAHFDEIEVISSHQLGQSVGASAAKVRKDLSYFGEFGCKGVGYDVKNLKKRLGEILGFNKIWSMILVGTGNLGRALVNYQEFVRMGLHFAGIFDCDLSKIGNRVGELVVKSNHEIKEVVQKREIKIAVMAVPASEAHQVGKSLVDAGIKAIWNFAPVPLKWYNLKKYN